MKTGLARRRRRTAGWRLAAVRPKTGAVGDRPDQRFLHSLILHFPDSLILAPPAGAFAFSLYRSTPYCVFVTLLNIRGLSVLRPLALVRW